MASLSPSGDRPPLTPLSMFYPRRASSSGNPYPPPTSSLLSPRSTSLPPLETSATATNSHYYRPPRSSLTSPTRSNISSPAHSPTRATRQSRIQSLLATDPLLSHLTPVTIIRLSTSEGFDFEPGEKEWSLRAAEGTVKVNEWLREVEGWNREWRRSDRESKYAGDGYLPPADRPKKRRKTGMGSIREEEEDAMLDGSKSVRRRLFSEDSGAGGSEGVIVKDGMPKVGAVEPPELQTDSPSFRRSGKPLTPYQLKVQRQKAAEVGSDSTLIDGTSEPDQILAKPVEKIGAREVGKEEEKEEEEEDDELEESVEYWGSLKRSVAEGYEARIEVIKSEIEELDVDGLKDRVLSYRTGAANPLTDSSAIMAATTLQLLPPLSRLTKLLSIWAVRIAVLRIVPVFLRWLQIAKDALEAGYTAITHPSINPESSSLDKGWRGLEEESYTLMQETITQKVATAGRLMDTMLDALEGREDVLPEKWITELEDVEEGVSRWEMDGERVVLEGRLRLEEMRMRQSRKEEEAREREKTLLVLEQERSAQEARVEEEAAMDVMEKAEETDRRLREALETNDIVAEAIELPDDNESDWIEPDSSPEDLEELFSKLEDVEKERSLSGEGEDRGRRPERAGSVDTVPSSNGVGSHLDPPEPPTASGALVVEEEDQNEFLPVEEESELPTAANGTFFSRLFSATPQTQLRKAKQTSEEAHSFPVAVPSSGTSEKPASETAVNVSATLPEETARSQLPQQQQDEDERIRRTISQQMEQNLSQGQSTWSEPRTPSALAHTEEKPEEENENKDEQSEEAEKEEDGEKGEGEDELQGTSADDEAIRLKLVQQMERMMIDSSNQSQPVEAGVISTIPIPGPARTVEQLQSQPQISSALPTEDDELIRQRITRDMERSLAGTSASQLERKEEGGSSQPTVASQPTSSTVLSSPTTTAPQQSQFPTEDEEVQSRSTGSVMQPEIQREGRQVSPLASVQSAAVPVVGAIPAQRSHAQVNTPQDDEAVRYQIQQEMQRLLESGGTLSTSTAVVAVDEPVKSAEEPAEEESPFSTPPRSVRHPSPPIIGDDDQIRRKIVTEMEQFVNSEHAPRAAASSGSTNQELQQRILQPEPRPITAPAGDNEDEQIRQQIVRQMEEMLIRDAAPAINEPALQGPISHIAEVVEQAPPASYTTATQAVPVPQVISSDDERIRQKVVGEMETLLRGESTLQQPQPVTISPAIPVQQATAQPAQVSVQPTSSETLAGDEAIKQRVTAEMEESLKKERSQESTSGQSGAQQAALHAESEKRVDEKREAEAEHHQLAPEQAEGEGITKLAEAEEKALEAEAHKAAELGARRLAEEEELAERARLELGAEKAAEAERLLLAEEAAQKEKAAELERLAEAERQRLDAQRHEEESAAAKALEERRAVEAERAAVVEAARQVFVREQTGFDDKKFQELDRQRRLAEDERMRSADTALAERERAREAKQQAERIQREREIEEERVKAETLRQGEGGALGVDAPETKTDEFQSIETSSTATLEDDLASDVFNTAAESDGSGDDLDYSDIWKAQTGYETPRATQEPISEDVFLGEVSRGLESVMATPKNPAPSSLMPINQPAATGLPSPPDLEDQGYELSDETDIKLSVEMPSNLTHVQDEVSETSSDMDNSGDGENGKEDRSEKEANEFTALDSGGLGNLVMGCEDVEGAKISELLLPETFVGSESPAAGLGNIPNLFAPGQSMLGSPEASRSIEDFRHYNDEDFLLSRGYSFDTPSIVLAPSTPQKGNTPQKGDSLEYDHNGDFVATPRRNDMSQSPDSRNGSFGTSFSCASMDEGDRADMSDSMGYFEQEESSEIEIKPVATSTPKGNRRLTVSTGLDSIVEVLTPRSARGQHFDVSDLYRNENPSLDGSSRAEERVGPVGDGISSSLSGPGETMEKGMLPIELSEKVAKREISRDPTRATSASKNRSVAPRSSTPTLGKVLAKDQKQRFTLGSSSSTPSGAAGYKRPTSRAEARPSSRQGNHPSSRAQEFRTPSRASDTKTARPSSRAGPSTPSGPGDDGSNSSTPTGTPAPAIRPMRRLRRDTISTTGADSDDDDDDDPRRFFRENTPEINNSDFAKAPKLQVTKRHARQPSNFTSIVTPEKSSRFNKGPYVAEGSSLVLPTTPILQPDLDDKINEILGSLPSKVRLTASNLQKLSESTKRLPPIKPFDLSSPTGIPGPKSVESSPSIASEVPSYARASARRHNSSSPGDIKLYHLHRTDGQAPIKLYIRLVGENGERVMVRVGGGWADLAEYLKEYATHHGSKRRVVSEGRVEIQDLSTHSHHGRTLHPSRSISSFRSASPGPMGSRPSSPLPGGNRPSTSFSMRRPESPILMKRSESENPSLHTNPTMRGGHNGTLPGNNKTSPTTPSDEAFPLQPITATQLTPPNRNSPPSRPGSRPGSSSSAGYRRPTSRLSFSESAFDDYGSINGHSPPSLLPPPQPLGLAGPKGKHVHPENQAWVEGVLGQVRKASADRRAQLLAAAAGHYGEGGVEEVVVEGSVAIGGGGQGGDYSGREFGGRLGEIGKVGGTRRLFAKKG